MAIERHCDPAAARVLLDVTRLVELRWSRRQPNGIDRVAGEYLRHYAPRAQAVMQHRGVIGVLDRGASRALFDLLARDDVPAVRARIAVHVARALAARRPVPAGAVYLNVSHTDYDLPAHHRWIARHGLHAVYLIHDLIPLTDPEHCRPHAVRRHEGRVRAALRHAAGIIVGSGAVERDLLAFARVEALPAPAILHTPLAGARLPQAAAAPGIANDYFLCPGTIESRKNHILLAEVWAALHARYGQAAPRLLVVGGWGHGARAFRAALAASGHAGGLIRIIEDCDDARLAQLLAGARAVLLPSLAEGFGLPMAEALARGVPVIASDIPAFREVGQGHARLLPPDDPAAWETAIASFDPAAAARPYRATRWGDHFARVDPWLATLGARAAVHRLRA